MSLYSDLPLLSGWKWQIVQKGIAAQQAPYTFNGNQTAVSLPASAGWLFALGMAQTDPDLLATVTVDNQPYYSTPRNLVQFGSVGPLAAEFVTPLIGVTLTDYPSYGPTYGFQYVGWAAPLAFGTGLLIQLSTKLPSATIMSLSLTAVQVVDKAAFFASANALYGGNAPAAVVAALGPPSTAASCSVTLKG